MQITIWIRPSTYVLGTPNHVVGVIISFVKFVSIKYLCCEYLVNVFNELDNNEFSWVFSIWHLLLYNLLYLFVLFFRVESQITTRWVTVPPGMLYFACLAFVYFFISHFIAMCQYAMLNHRVVLVSVFIIVQWQTLKIWCAFVGLLTGRRTKVEGWKLEEESLESALKVEAVSKIM